ncbi:division initiation protein [Clostridium beijerinckii]|nr:division initiation protein [Clostridium beijerinckii]
MKNNKGFFFVFIATIILGALISMNFNFEGIQSYSQLNATEYQNAVEERATLYKEIGNLKEDNIEKKDKIENYENNYTKNDKILEDMKAQISDYQMFIGLNKTEGSGILLKINDGNTNALEENTSEINNKLLHDNDMALILNELRVAGAEAISVNSHRVIPWSGVICNWAFIGFDDGGMEYAPFNIYAIGDPEKLKAALLEDGSHVKELIFRKLYVNIEEIDKIIMPPTTSNANIKYMERDESKK